MTKCKFNRKLKCFENACDDRCKIFRELGQQVLVEKPLKVIKKKKTKGVTTTYYKVEK